MEKKHLELKITTKTEHENLRTRLVKLFSRHKGNLSDLDYDDGTGELSLCAEFNSIGGVSVFKIDRRKRKEPVEYELIEEPTK